MTKLDKAEGNQDQQPIYSAEAAAVVQAVTVEFSGPVLHPQLLRQYNEVVPHGADRIVKLTEAQVQHRQLMETRGQLFAFTLAVITLLSGVALIALGRSAQGLVPLVAAVAGLGGLFIYRELRFHRAQKQL